MTATGCRLLEWDSAQFGCRIGRVESLTPDDAQLEAAVVWARHAAMDCLYLLTSNADPCYAWAAARHGFALMDLRLTYRRAIAPDLPFAGAGQVRTATTADIPALRAMTRGTFGHTRFYRDPGLAGAADAFYATWVERAVEGFADEVLVTVDASDAPTGFVCCHRREGGDGELGLTAVRADLRGRGMGSILVEAACTWFQAEQLRRAVVVTNAANLTAQRLYQRHGFLSDRVELWFHRWSTGNLPAR